MQLPWHCPAPATNKATRRSLGAGKWGVLVGPHRGICEVKSLSTSGYDSARHPRDICVCFCGGFGDCT